ncbi:hypothetical protein K443DRAFT_30369, partial [Laccaria amethystina LaAM-08-1]
ESHRCLFSLLTLVQHHHSKSLQNSEGTQYQSKQPRWHSSWPSPPPNHLVSTTSTILDVKARFHSTERLNDRIPRLSTLRACRRSAPLSVLSDSQPFPPLLVPPKKAAVTPLFTITPPP